MIDPNKITRFDRTQAELEEFAIFSVLVAGKTAKVISRCLQKFLGNCTEPFSYIRDFRFHDKDSSLAVTLKNCGVGCYTSKAETLYQLVRYGLDLKICSPQDLEQINGIGPKTSRFFIMHSRPNQRFAALDRHILRYIKEEHGIACPKNTPSKKRYAELEKKFLEICDKLQTDPATLDLQVWNKYSSRRKSK